MYLKEPVLHIYFYIEQVHQIISYDDEQFILPASSPPASPSAGPGQRPYTQKMCWRYNRTGFCSFPNCIFRHICTSCHGRHPASRCGDRQPASARAVGKAPSNPRAPHFLDPKIKWHRIINNEIYNNFHLSKIKGHLSTTLC